MASRGPRLFDIGVGSKLDIDGCRRTAIGVAGKNQGFLLDSRRAVRHTACTDLPALFIELARQRGAFRPEAARLSSVAAAIAQALQRIARNA